MTNSLTIFDIDDTLFKTTARVGVIKNGKRIRMLTAGEFNSYVPKPGESLDYSQFRSAAHFAKTAKPVDTMFRTAKKMMERLKGDHKRFIIVTAREDFDDPSTFLNTFRKYGFDVDRSHVHRAGNYKGLSSHDAKKIVIRKEIAKIESLDIIRMFDDAVKNLQSFLELHKEFPHIKFEAFLVHDDGRISRYK